MEDTVFGRLRSKCGRILGRDSLYCAAVLVLASAQGAGAWAQESVSASAVPSDWSLSISPYAWAAGLEGSIAAFPRAPEVDVDLSFKDALQNLDLAGMAFVELRYRRFAGFMDLVYVSLSDSVDTPFGVLFDDVTLKTEMFIGTFGVSYRPIETEQGSVDVLLGARAWSVDTTLKLDGNLAADRKFENGENWVDPVVGLSGRYHFDNGVFLASLFNIGGFGAASDLTWDAFGGVGYDFNDMVSALAGYRHLEVDYRHDGFVFDAELSGPVIGVNFRF